MKQYIRRGGGDAEFPRQPGFRFTVQIHAANQFSITRAQRGQKHLRELPDRLGSKGGWASYIHSERNRDDTLKPGYDRLAAAQGLPSNHERAQNIAHKSISAAVAVQMSGENANEHSPL